ncbi:hypothetical protein BpHYR1_012464 [Brachionus plicatilis]|uniref:Uncharacterized protein n=1 Tax=Brachionus plicatilis TaxID=10195 RepID=A0A3M7PBK1_BRAPC|nr:hypothetical protein BpHYR1_012464 [Brachionus plicatilis]
MSVNNYFKARLLVARDTGVKQSQTLSGQGREHSILNRVNDNSNHHLAAVFNFGSLIAKELCLVDHVFGSFEIYISNFEHIFDIDFLNLHQLKKIFQLLVDFKCLLEGFREEKKFSNSTQSRINQQIFILRLHSKKYFK